MVDISERSFVRGRGASAKAMAEQLKVVFENEAKCPECQAAKVRDEGTTLPGICEPHQRGRRVLGLSGLR